MEWGFVVLILGALIYIAGIIVDYTNFHIQIQPRISGTEERAVEIALETDVEAQEHQAVLERIQGGKEAVEDLQKKIDDRKKRTRNEQIRKRRLDMVLLKSRLKGGRGLILV